MRRNAFKPYSPGEKVSNSRVLAIAHLDGTLTRYRVKNLCCGEEVVLAHKSLDDRRRRGVLQCARCSARTNQSQGRATALEERQRESRRCMRSIRGRRVCGHLPTKEQRHEAHND